MAKPIYKIETGKPFPPKGTPGPKPGSVRSGFRKYLPQAEQRIAEFGNCEDASYNLAHEFVGKDSGDFEGLRSFFRRHLSEHYADK
jgi:hypothetical protein